MLRLYVHNGVSIGQASYHAAGLNRSLPSDTAARLAAKPYRTVWIRSRV